MVAREIMIAAVFAVVFIGSLFYIGGTSSSSYFASSTTLNCTLRNRHIGLFDQCVNDIISVTIAPGTTVLQEQKSCSHHPTINRDVRTSQILWGFWFIFFLLLTLSVIITIVIWISRRITIARRLSLLSAVLAFLTFIMLIVSYSVLTSTVNKGNFLFANKCGFGIGFTFATIGFVISIIGFLPLIGILVLAGIKGLKR